MRLIITGGGTGGHVYPALAVISELLGAEPEMHVELPGVQAAEERAGVKLLYLGNRAGMEADIVARLNLPFRGITAGAVRGRSPLAIFLNLIRTGVGLWQSLRIIRSFQPDVILATGGYVCVPVAVAGWLARVPILVYLPDIKPGLAVKFLARLATRIAVTVNDSRSLLPTDKVIVTGYPLKRRSPSASKLEARKQLSLPETERVMLIMGGSRGAQSINKAVAAALPDLLAIGYIIHISGQQDWGWLEKRRNGLSVEDRKRYRLYPYLYEELETALTAADLVVSRAGASSLGYFPLFGLASILIPYPYAGGHQEANADYLVSRGAALKIEDYELADGALPTAIKQLLEDESLRCSLADRASHLAIPDAARRIAETLCHLAGQELVRSHV
ncbi:MAG: UDP-N-acetylglucosamine--N-acetylmuramyl-(pentapeptide) pyrophosphoryl-undecaprenol N-acetylglucosamine transferase [Chloroflexi bacterium]|nr:UDP-N-acetylglucosamine--N-acetylmuramyl-(pentapeptide) pyrophosphoryl-undecaprenol N-acetylglucosamine transferase [Chloroflexota bacterium]MCL5075649.1 UDP-N-acetylglucosamine--N-acetylmuramyl-(pentapeptide) pyrophosphoryl-undecaprenol N-acetylglucosamine transferase [Chloroflexota bacterium]